MPVERRGQVTDVGSEPTGNRRSSNSRREAASELELHYCSRKSVAETYLLATRCPVYRRHDSRSGSRTELENLSGDAKGKGTSSETARPKVPMRRAGADCSVVARKRGNARGAKGAGHRRGSEPTGNGRSSNSRWEAAAFVRWHEPDDARVSSPDLWSARGETLWADSAALQ